MIQVEGLSFEYPGLRALDDVSFDVEPGSITALVGPNGAGKTTLLRCIAALEQPLSGRIHVDGIDVTENPRECHRRIGYLSDFFGLYNALTVSQCLRFAAGSQGVEQAAVEERVEGAARDVGLADRLNVRAGTLSRGLRQRLGIGQAIIHEPRVLLLDEPASGLDPEARHALSQLLRRLCARGMTLMVSSHILAELEEYCTAMLILHAGRVAGQQRLADGGRDMARLRITLSEPVADLAQRLQGLADQGEAIEIVETGPLHAALNFSAQAGAQHELLKRLLAAGLPVCGFYEEQVNLQDSYLATVRAADAVRAPAGTAA